MPAVATCPPTVRSRGAAPHRAGVGICCGLALVAWLVTSAGSVARAADGQVKLDFWGDPLPSGALVRLGTLDREAKDRGHDSGVYAVSFSPDGLLVATGGGDGAVRLWDALTGKPGAVLEGHDGIVAQLEFSPDGKHLASAGSRDSNVHVWEVATARELRLVPAAEALFHFLPEKDRLQVLSGGKLTTIDVVSGETKESREGPASPIVFSPDGAFVLARPRDNDADSRVLVRKLSTGKDIAIIPAGKSQARRGAIAPDGRTAAIRRSSEDEQNRIDVYEVATAQRLFALAGHEKMVHAMTFSPDGWFLASASGDQTVRVWEAITGNELRVLRGHTSHVSAVAFSPDGRRLASASVDRTALIWDVSPATFVTDLPKELSPADLEKLWIDLSELSAPVGRRAVGVMSSLAKTSVPYLEEQLAAVLRPTQLADILDWIDKLDDDAFQVRDEASRNLLRLREIAEPHLKKAYIDASAEARYRIRRILLARAAPPRFSAAEIRRLKRVVQVLENAPPDLSRKLLDRLATEFPDGDVTREARLALERLDRLAMLRKE